MKFMSPVVAHVAASSRAEKETGGKKRTRKDSRNCVAYSSLVESLVAREEKRKTPQLEEKKQKGREKRGKTSVYSWNVHTRYPFDAL